MMTSKRNLRLEWCALIALQGVVGAMACGTDSNDCDHGPCRPAQDAGPNGILPPECRTDPQNNPNCDKYALFVAPASAGGLDSAAGTKTDPLATISQAISAGDAMHPLIYICQGTYDEQVNVTRAINLYGGFDCSTWLMSNPPGETKVAPSKPGYALTVTTVQLPLTIADLLFISQPGVNAGDSSIAGWLTDSQTVTLERVTLTAGNGAAGNPTVQPTSNPYPGPAHAPDGNDSDGGAPAPAQVNTCLGNENSVGGAGGGPGDGGPGSDGVTGFAFARCRCFSGADMGWSGWTRSYIPGSVLSYWPQRFFWSRRKACAQRQCTGERG